MCCAIAALLVAIVAAWRAVFKGAFNGLADKRWAAALAAAGIALIAGSALAARQFDGGATRAQVSQRGMLAEMLAGRICGPDASKKLR